MCSKSDDGLDYYRGFFKKKAENMLFSWESQKLEQIWKKNPDKRFVKIGKIWMYKGRLDEGNQFTTADVDVKIMFDAHEFTGFMPIVTSDSPIFYAYLIHVHQDIRPHSGYEITTKEMMKKMFAIGAPRKLIRAVRNACTHCKIMNKKTVVLEMANHHKVRTTISPPFYNIMADVVYGFSASSHKRARSTIKVYALILVCLLTGATNILVLEGIETQDITAALERHSSRYGAPACIYIDNGAQLAALEGTQFSMRDLNGTINDSMGIQVKLSSPKNHEERGRCEAKVKQLREMLKKLAVDTTDPVTPVLWETIFAKASSHMDDIPIAQGDGSNLSDLGFEILTPNRLKIGRNSNRSIDGTIRFTNAALPSDILNRNRKITSCFMQILIDRIHLLQKKTNKWLHTAVVTPKPNDVVLYVSDESAASEKKRWKLGKVASTTDRTVNIVYPVLTNKSISWGLAIRGWRQVSIIVGSHELSVNSKEFHRSIVSKTDDNHTDAD